MIHPDFVKTIVEKLPPDVVDILRQYGPNLCVAGGFCRDVITGAEPKDVDLFGVTYYTVDCAVGVFVRKSKHYGSATPTKNGSSVRPLITEAAVAALEGKPIRVRVTDEDYGPGYIVKTVHSPEGLVIPVQFISGKGFYATHLELLESFDFTICQAAVYYDKDKHTFIGVATNAFWNDVTTGTLHYTLPKREEDPGSSILRMVRFAQRGWKVSEEEIAKCVGRFYFQLTQKQLPANVFPKDEPESIEFISTTFSRVAY